MINTNLMPAHSVETSLVRGTRLRSPLVYGTARYLAGSMSP